MKQLMVSTRGTYDLHDGHSLEKYHAYNTIPARRFNKVNNAEEITIFIHGMRNSRKGAQMGTNALRLKLRKMGYKYPVIGFSYDSDIRGAHIKSKYYDVVKIATKIAYVNGMNKLGLYIRDLLSVNPNIRIRLVGHSLGCIVIEGLVNTTSQFNMFPNNLFESISLFGSPLEIDKVAKIANSRNVKVVINHYNPKDTEIQMGVDKGDLIEPSCLVKTNDKKLKSKLIHAKDHRFKQQMKALMSFP